MKNVHYIIEGVLAAAIVALFVMQFSGRKESPSVVRAAPDGNEGTANALPVAYINVDSLLMNYNYAKDLYEIQMKSQENARLNLSQKVRDLDQDATDFQRKLENNAFLTRERAEQEQQRILKKRQDVEDFNNRTTNDLMAEQQRMNEVLRDTIVSQLKTYNIDKHFHLILSNTGGDNILFAEDAYDITAEILEILNKNYSPAK
jgi:outer membrane protein